jgi:hypothetical protein
MFRVHVFIRHSFFSCQNISSWSTFISYTFHNYPKVNPGDNTMVPYPSFTRTFIVQSA